MVTHSLSTENYEVVYYDFDEKEMRREKATDGFDAFDLARDEVGHNRCRYAEILCNGEHEETIWSEDEEFD